MRTKRRASWSKRNRKNEREKKCIYKIRKIKEIAKKRMKMKRREIG